jgi:uncharacterized protein
MTPRRTLAPATAALVLIASVVWAALTFPALSGRVVDEAGLLTAAEIGSLTDILAAHEQATTNQVVVVTLPSLQGTSIEDYGYQLGRHWGIGQKGKDNGALLIVAPNERKVRIEVGYGLEGELTDAASKLIIENIIVPAFKSGQFGPGIVAGTGAILKVLGGGDMMVEPERRGLHPAWVIAILVGSIVLFIVLSLWSSRKSKGLRRTYRYPVTYGTYGGSGIGGVGFDDLGGGFGSSGGGFSGGGGSFGGGGASGRW